MQRKIVTVFSIALIVWGLLGLALGNVIVGLCLIFANMKKYDLRFWLCGFGVLYIFASVGAYALGYVDMDAYTILLICIGAVLFALTFLPWKKRPPVSQQGEGTPAN